MDAAPPSPEFTSIASSAHLNFLRTVHLFRGLTDEELAEILPALQPLDFKVNDSLAREGELGDVFYLLLDGTVEVLMQDVSEEPVMFLSPGDYFGDTTLLDPERLRSATMRAATPVKTLTLDRDNFDILLVRFPQVKTRLARSLESRDFYVDSHYHWLAANERIYLDTQRHILVLLQKMLLPLSLLLIALLGAGVAWWSFNNVVLALTLAGVATLPSLGWVVWSYIDWGNDHFIVTNQRVVYLEKIVAIYDSRQEAPLTSIRSVRVEAPDYLARQVGLGNVVIGTFSGPITMQSVPDPEGLAEVVKEHWERAKNQAYRSRQQLMEDALRQRIRPAPPPRPPQPIPEHQRPRRTGPPLFSMRFEQGESVIYRKHWFVLIKEIWIPSALMLALAVLIGLRAGGVYELPWAAIWLVVFILSIPLVGWWVYEFVDWQNDIYQVTPERILDIHRKPLGAESRKEAPLDNVLSLKYERPGILGILLNFGTVTAKVATEDFKFEGVYDPVGVQNDVYRRLEARNAAREKAERDRRQGEFVEWFEVYHKVANEAPPPKK